MEGRRCGKEREGGVEGRCGKEREGDVEGRRCGEGGGVEGARWVEERPVFGREGGVSKGGVSEGGVSEGGVSEEGVSEGGVSEEGVRGR